MLLRRLLLLVLCILQSSLVGAQTRKVIPLWGGQQLSTPIRRPAQREIVAHARSLGLVNSMETRGAGTANNKVSSKLTTGLSKAIVSAEVAKAAQIDPRSTPAFTKRWYRRFSRAQDLKPAKQRVLFGFSRLIDAKVKVTPGFASALSTHAELDPTTLASARRAGPRPDGTWGVIDSPEKLVAAMEHDKLHGGGASLQLQISPAVSAWLERVIAQTGTVVSRAVGGAAAYGANLATHFNGTQVSFHSAQTVSPEQARGFVPRVRIVTRESGPRGVSSRNPRASDPTSPTKTNYILESVGTGRNVGRIILSTEATYPPTFDPSMGKKELGALARANDVFIMVGPHYLTGYEPRQLERTGLRLRWQLREMRRANPDLLVHYQYVRAKDPTKEWRTFRLLDGMIDSLSLNATELGALVENLAGHPIRMNGGTVRLPKLPPATSRDDLEQPARIHQLATALIQGLGIERLHIHAYDVDMILVRGGSAARMHREGQAALKGRQLGINKVVNPSGQVRYRREGWPLIPTLEGQSLGTLHRFADALQTGGKIDQRGRALLVEQGLFMDRSSGISVSVTPTRQFHLDPGGRVSLGDTFDITTLLHAHRPAARR
jgi:hypothetical protein